MNGLLRHSLYDLTILHHNQIERGRMSLSKIQEQIKKSEAEIAAKKIKHTELQKKMAESLSKLIIQSGIIDTPITEEELLKELENIAARFRPKEEKKST